MATNKKDHETLVIAIIGIVWMIGMLCGAAFTLLIQAGIIVK